MRYQITGREVSVMFDEVDATTRVVTGHTTGLRERTIRPVRMTIKVGSDVGVYRILVEGPSVRANGTVGAAYFGVLVGMGVAGPTDRYPAAPKWLRAIIAEVAA